MITETMILRQAAKFLHAKCFKPRSGCSGCVMFACVRFCVPCVCRVDQQNELQMACVATFRYWHLCVLVL